MKAKFSHNKSRNVGTSNIYQFAPKNLFLAKFHITSQGMWEHHTFISLILNINFEPNSIFQAKKCRNIELLSVQFENWFGAKFHIPSQGMQKHRTFISWLLEIDFGQNSTLQAKECRNIEPLLVRFCVKFHIKSQGMQKYRTVCF